MRNYELFLPDYNKAKAVTVKEIFVSILIKTHKLKKASAERRWRELQWYLKNKEAISREMKKHRARVEKNKQLKRIKKEKRLDRIILLREKHKERMRIELKEQKKRIIEEKEKLRIHKKENLEPVIKKEEEKIPIIEKEIKKEELVASTATFMPSELEEVRGAKRILFDDMIRYKMKLTPAVLKQNGFFQTEINWLLMKGLLKEWKIVQEREEDGMTSKKIVA